jgi:CRISPR type III-A-associated RAMP protein Csm4
MSPGYLVRLRPTGPWRIGPDSGARNRVDRVYHSDTLYAAVCSAMRQLGQLDEWLAATAAFAGAPAVRFSSAFPFHRDTLFVEPPKSHWPPPPSAKVRWKGARFVPLTVVETLLAEKHVDEERWTVDGESECLIPTAAASRAVGPFRAALRVSAAVDRITGANVEPHETACLEFRAEAGLWTMVVFEDQDAENRWGEPVKAAFRLLADSGFGGERSRGWGHAAAPEFSEGEFPAMLLSAQPPAPSGVEGETVPVFETAHWLLAMYSPAEDDAVEWRRGTYTYVTRGGRVDSAAGHGAAKRALRMVTEGSVVFAGAPPRGAAPDVAQDGFPHPVYRYGRPVAVPIPVRLPNVAKVAP